MERREFIKNTSLALVSAALQTACSPVTQTSSTGVPLEDTIGEIKFDAKVRSFRLPRHDGPTRWIADSDCYIKFGNDRVVARPQHSMRFNNGTELFLMPKQEYISVVALQANGTLVIELLDSLRDSLVEGAQAVDTDRVLNYRYEGPHGSLDPSISLLPDDAQKIRICVEHTVVIAFGSNTNPPTPLRSSGRRVELSPGTHLLNVPDGASSFAAINAGSGRDQADMHGVLNLVCMEA